MNASCDSSMLSRNLSHNQRPSIFEGQEIAKALSQDHIALFHLRVRIRISLKKMYMKNCVLGLLFKKKTVGVFGYAVMRIDLGERRTLPNPFESVDSIAKRARSKNRLHTFGPPARLRQTSACSGRNRGNVGEFFVSKTGFYSPYFAQYG